MQASTSPSEASGGYATRRGHVPQLSISDPSHHVTEAIGHMYEDDYDRRESKRLSYISSPLSEAITTIHPSLAGAEAPTSPQSLQVQNHLNQINQHSQTNGQSRPPLTTNKSFDGDSNPPSPGSTDTATTSFPLNDIDYESNPAAVAQELSNLAAIRRMSMDVAAAGDPDLPSLQSIASPSADENDTSRLFWVPARLHPELAPKEFKSFLESKSDHIKRKSGDFSLSPNGDESGRGLQRKRSMLSRQIDDSHGYTDGAERLEHKRSQSKRSSLSPNLHDLETLVDDSKPKQDPHALLKGVQALGISLDEDKPILPQPLGSNSLRRSTRTQYRKAGSLKKGEKFSRRVKSPESKDTPIPSIVTSSADAPILGLTRVSTDPTANAARRGQATAQTAADSSTSTQGSTFESILDHTQSEGDTSKEGYAADTGNRVSSPAQPRQWHSRISSNGRSTLNIPPTEQKVPEIVETPPSESNHSHASSGSQQNNIPEREPLHEVQSHVPSKGSPLNEQNVSKRSRQHGKESTLNDFANNPPALPGNTTRTDSLSFIPTLPEERKTESKKSKDKKDSEGGRKSSWHWLLGSEEKEKEKEKKREREREKEREKDGDSRKIKNRLVDKVHETANSIPSSSDNNQRGRESFAYDRLDPKLEEERRKDSARRTSGESKKEKESGLFSSIFGGGRKKHSGDGHHHKKSLSRTLSPEPPVRILQPDVDYPWTRFSILEERAIYRMAHIKLANPRRALCSQVLLSNFMYSYLAKVQQMHPHMMVASSAAQRQQQKAREQEEYMQYQRYQAAQEQQYDGTYDDPQMYEYNDDSHDPYRSQSGGDKHGYENGNSYGPGHYQYGNSTFGDDAQLDDDDDDDMW